MKKSLYSVITALIFAVIALGLSNVALARHGGGHHGGHGYHGGHYGYHGGHGYHRGGYGYRGYYGPRYRYGYRYGHPRVVRPVVVRP